MGSGAEHFGSLGGSGGKRLGWRAMGPVLMKAKLAAILVAWAALCVVGANQAVADQNRAPDHFVPNSQEFWDFSKNWTTNYGPAYRDTVEQPSNFLACTGQFALCVHSRAKPLPCKLTKDGRFADCTCTVMNSINFVLITAILNREVYDKTVKACGADGADCTAPNDAPVCKFLNNGKLIPGAELISTYDTSSTNEITDAMATEPGRVTNCDGPFAGCMTAPCTFTPNGNAKCSCPVFWGRFQLIGAGAVCDLGGDLVPSASYNPHLDPNVP